MKKKKERQNLFLFPRMKKSTFLILGVLLIAASVTYAISATSAYPKDLKQANVLTSITDLEVVVEDKDPITELKIDETSPRDVKIFNNATTSQYIRVLVFPTYTTSADVLMDLEIEDLIQPLDNTTWKKGEDGYFYYLKQLPSGQKTDSLFKEIVFPKAKGADGDVLLTLKVESIVAANLEYREAFWGSDKEPEGIELKAIDSVLSNLGD